MIDQPVDFSKYLGLWHEVARIDAGFERDCIRATARYTQEDPRLITVENTCIRLGAPPRTIVGQAQRGRRPNELLVALGSVPQPAQYLVEYVSLDYQEALVGNDARTFMWVLFRAPKMPYPRLQRVLEVAQRRGYDLGQVVL